MTFKTTGREKKLTAARKIVSMLIYIVSMLTLATRTDTRIRPQRPQARASRWIRSLPEKSVLDSPARSGEPPALKRINNPLRGATHLLTDPLPEGSRLDGRSNCPVSQLPLLRALASTGPMARRVPARVPHRCAR